MPYSNSIIDFKEGESKGVVEYKYTSKCKSITILKFICRKLLTGY